MRILLTDTTWNMAILAKKLRDQGFFVSEAGDVPELMEYIQSGQQDAVIIDPDLPSGEVFALIRQLRAMNSRLPICLNTRDADDKFRMRALSAGADDIFNTDLPMEELAARLRAYVRRSSGFATAKLDVGDLRIDLEAQKVCLRDMPVHLTRLEYELIETMALRNGALISRDQIMLQLYAWKDEPDAKIIDVYICRIRAKLAAAGAREEVITTSFAQGYRLNARAEEVLPDAA